MKNIVCFELSAYFETILGCTHNALQNCLFLLQL